jgi:hypothetical protein
MQKFLLSLFLFITVAYSTAYSISKKEEGVPDTVHIGAYVLSLHDINFKDKEYTMRLWLWMLYSNPEFDFTTQVEVPNAKSIEKPDVMVDTIDGKIWVLMKMKCVMKQNWKVHDYPFDRQQIKVHVENTMFDASHLVFVPDTLGSKFDNDFAIDGWDISNFKVSTGINEYSTAFGDITMDEQHSEYGAFCITLDLERNAWGLFFKLFLGMYISFFIAAISFVIDPEDVDPKFGLPVGGLFASVGNKYIIDSILPETTLFTLVDSLHSTTFLFILFIIASNAYSLILDRRKKRTEARSFNKTAGKIILTAYFFVNIFLVIVAIYK